MKIINLKILYVLCISLIIIGALAVFYYFVFWHVPIIPKAATSWKSNEEITGTTNTSDDNLFDKESVKIKYGLPNQTSTDGLEEIWIYSSTNFNGNFHFISNSLKRYSYSSVDISNRNIKTFRGSW